MKTSRILIAEDDKKFREELVKHLNTHFTVEIAEASNGDEALRLVESETFDVILTDHMMPGADGLRILIAAKKKDPQQVVLVITGTENERLTQKIESAGGLFIAKPINLRVVQMLIERAFEQKGGLNYKKV